ncbi:hypothetical protein BN8_p06842 (plasmid) [Fibrisoma limi BUZ 3]|uniref:DUF305 domain-containing protein n=1 Tax=Fibrisoma limi BUZ 3 TaxID=1185876 RepID=I2GU40_9BACT|nr:DUF305 domain-containing protein [Fibrisoma limi]CCH57641.1 hypothetical protein BN8_p06842 [Fibrisoma limi BUZ 3]
MKQMFLVNKTLAVLSLAATLALTSCSKIDSTDVAPGEETEIDFSARKSSDDPNDQAFDREMTRIFREMQRMVNDMPMTGDPDMDFAMMMSMHHQLGIDVGNAELRYGKHPEGKELAEESNRGNAESRERLQSYLRQHPAPERIDPNVYQQFMREMRTAMQTMNRSFRRVPNTPDVDIDFARKLLEHHEGAIDMANIQLKYGNDRAPLDEGKIIIISQGAEIIELAEFVNEHGIPNTTEPLSDDE